MASQIISAIALDLGTTSVKAALLDSDGGLRNLIVRPAPEINTDQGRCESDALRYAATAEQVLAVCQAQTDNKIPLGLCSQRSSFLVWESANGRPLTPLISWQDNRGMHCFEAIKGSEEMIRSVTGLCLTPYYFAPKLSVLLKLNPDWRIRLVRGELMVGTLDSFLIWRWTGGKFHITDASMAARTLLMDINNVRWSPELCQCFDIPLSILPEIKTTTDLNLDLDNGFVLQTSIGDQSAALVASIGNDRSAALVNLGTGGFVIRYQAAEESVPAGYLKTLVYLDNERTHLANEGTLNSISVALAPYPIDQCRIEDLAENDIFCLAEPSGLGAPYFRPGIGVCFSQSVGHLTANQVAALLLEAIIFRVVQILSDFHRSSPVSHVYLSGGLSENNCLQQGIAQCVPYAVSKLQQKETTLQGGAILAAGIMSGSFRTAKKITCASRNSLLQEKYRCWKEWLDGLLAKDLETG